MPPKDVMRCLSHEAKEIIQGEKKLKYVTSISNQHFCEI